MDLKKLVLVFAFLLGLVVSAQALTITIDGNLDDWGLNLSSFTENGNDWDPGLSGVYVFQEDWVGSGDYVGPGWGGQNYDVEAILVTADTENLYVAISTGFPQWGIKDWDAGDIFFDVGDDDIWDYALIVSDYEDGDNSRPLTPGSLYKVFSWEDVDVSEHSVSNPYRLATGSFLGSTDFIYANHSTDEFARYIIEAAIPLSYLGSPGKITIHWTMECGNDYGEVTATVPEPASLLLVGAGLFALGVGLRKKFKT